MKTLTRIEVNPSGDGYLSIFLNGNLLIHGDDYHDKIRDQYNGIKAYLEHVGEKFKEEKIALDVKTGDQEWSDYDYMPDTEETLDEYLTKMKENFKPTKP